jgi:hypothetical protein
MQVALLSLDSVIFHSLLRQMLDNRKMCYVTTFSRHILTIQFYIEQGADEDALALWGRTYEAYSENKYRLRIFPPQRGGRDFAHARCLPSFIVKPQTPIREKQRVFTYCSVRLKCSSWSSAPPTVKYGLLSVFLSARNVKPGDIHRQICEVPCVMEGEEMG